MYFASQIFFAVFTVFSLLVLPFSLAVPNVLSLLLFALIERVSNRHASKRKEVLQRLRRRKYICMTVGGFLLITSVMLSVSVVNVLKFFLIAPDVISSSVPDDPTEKIDFIKAAFEDYARIHPRLTKFLELFDILPIFIAPLITPFVLTLDYSQITLIHCHFEELTGEMIVKDIVAYGMSGMVGLAIFTISLFWAFNVIYVAMESDAEQHTLNGTVLNVINMLTASITIIVFQISFCRAVAERDVLGRRGRIWFAIAYCLVAFFLIYHFPSIVLAVFPGLNRLPKLFLKSVETALAVGALEHCRRSYTYLLSAARQKDAENIMVPVVPVIRNTSG